MNVFPCVVRERLSRKKYLSWDVREGTVAWNSNSLILKPAHSFIVQLLGVAAAEILQVNSSF
jgi:hypothetical protein